MVGWSCAYSGCWQLSLFTCCESEEMNWYTPLWRDPVGWADMVAKTKLRVVVCAIIHLGFVGWGLHNAQEYGVAAGAPQFIFSGVVYPCMYLWALHQLLKLAKETRGVDRDAENISSESTPSAPPDEPTT